MSISGNLHKSKKTTGQTLKNTLQPLLSELYEIPLLGVFGYVESIYYVKCSVQSQYQMLEFMYSGLYSMSYLLVMQLSARWQVIPGLLATTGQSCLSIQTILRNLLPLIAGY